MENIQNICKHLFNPTFSYIFIIRPDPKFSWWHLALHCTALIVETNGSAQIWAELSQIWMHELLETDVVGSGLKPYNDAENSKQNIIGSVKLCSFKFQILIPPVISSLPDFFVSCVFQHSYIFRLIKQITYIFFLYVDAKIANYQLFWYSGLNV